MDVYSVDSLDTDAAERVTGSLVNYLHHLNAKVIAPGLDTEERLRVARQLGVDGYTTERIAEYHEEEIDNAEEIN
jgi:EAL domain-containing protein (putative c-di-GMP-specific phosphodiesterase class I)